MTDRFTDQSVTVLTVNYNTPDLISRLVHSVRGHLGEDINIYIVDGSDQNIYKNVDDKNITHHKLGFNIHHGPGMNYGINRIRTPYTLILDSDTQLSSNILNTYNTIIPVEFYAAGHVCYVDMTGHVNGDSNGRNNGNASEFSIKYTHPMCLLINNDMYKKYHPFKKHGAPCLDNMIDISSSKEDDLLIHVDNNNLWSHDGRGTIKRWKLNV